MKGGKNMGQNGSDAIVTLKQAKGINAEIESILLATAKQMETRHDEFVNQISNIWEDKNAVEFIKVHKTNMTGFLDELQKNGNAFTGTVAGIANHFAEIAGIAERLTPSNIKLTANFNTSKVAEHFANGENGDEFGFKNPAVGAQQVMDAWQSLKNDLTKYANDAVTRINGINAFGKASIRMRLAESAGKNVSILEQHINDSKKQVEEYVNKTARRYVEANTSAEEAANLKVSSE